jgi:recombination protein RecA
MHPPYKVSNFNVVFGIGIDKIDEIMELGNEYEIFKKWGKTITLNETKYDIEEFKSLLLDNEDFMNDVKKKIVNKITQQPENQIIKDEENESILQEDAF